MTPEHALPNDTERLFAKGRTELLRRRGADFLEGRREGAYVCDEAGKRYLDCAGGAGTFNLGRRHPELAEALKTAARNTDQGNFPIISREKAELAEALAHFTPGGLECAVFSVVRGEAMEFACKVARGFTGRQELLTVDGGCYGQTGFAMSLSARTDRDAYAPLIPQTGTIPFGDTAAAEKAIGPNTAAIILEPIQAENHCQKASSEYLKSLATRCCATGALLVLDETQTGFGRTGAKFLCEALGVIPDLLILGEALGGGMFPIAATMLTQRVNAFMNDHPMIHLSTFGGHDAGCLVALKALEIYERERPWENALVRGTALKKGIEALSHEEGSPIAGVAGEGLLLSLDMGTEARAEALCREAAAKGLLLAPGEVSKQCVVLRPSLLLSEEETDEILSALAGAIEQLC